MIIVIIIIIIINITNITNIIITNIINITSWNYSRERDRVSELKIQFRLHKTQLWGSELSRNYPGIITNMINIMNIIHITNIIHIML